MADKRNFLVPGGALSSRLWSHIVKEMSGEESASQQSSRELEDSARLGECIGPYKLLRLLGSGGMGAVYLAECGFRESRATIPA